MKKELLLALAVSLFAPALYAQQPLQERPGRPGMAAEELRFSPGSQPPFVRGQIVLHTDGVLKVSKEVILNHTETDQLGQEHIRYQQTINGIPVDGATYVVHAVNGEIISENGTWIADVPAGLSPVPSISAAAALQSAMQSFGAKVYKWQLPAEEQFIRQESNDPAATFYPRADLVYYSGEEAVSPDHIRLAYRLDLYAQEPLGRRLYFIDAATGEVLGMREILHNIDATGSAVTAYSGTQAITTDSYSGSYRLREAGRGLGIQTFNLKKSTSYSAAVDFLDADNIWSNVNTTLDQYATDAHWGAEKTYDYYKNTFNRNSIDNAGYAIKSYVHYSSNYFNAFWDGTRMTYGDGNSKPLTAIDVCGHEITHGLTSRTAALNYSYESGALNEGFSDIFGTTIEFYAKPTTANWLIGEAFSTLRSMSNPKLYGQPNTYKGVNWTIGTADNGGVHTNSGVLNYWYYLLSQGGSGTNDNGTSYSVTGIGITKAAAIAYRTLTVYLVSNSQYLDARTYSIQAATDLYGATSNEVAQVTAAWTAVGVAPYTPPPPCTDNYEANETLSAAKAIANNADISGKISSGTDKDWFKVVTLSTAPKLKVTLTNLPANYDLILYKSNGSSLATSKNTGTIAESITYNATAAATYYIQVYGYNSTQYSAANCYTLRVATSNVNLLADQGITGSPDDSDAESEDDQIAGSQNIVDSREAIKLFPNPATDNLTISLYSDVSGGQEIYITDLTGRVLMAKSFDILEGRNDIAVDLKNYAAGMYFVKMQGRHLAKFQVTK